MEQIILFNVKEAEQIRKIASNIRVDVKVVDESHLDTIVEDIVNKRNIEQGTSDKKVEESLALFCELTDNHLDKMLAAIRMKKMDVTYKSVLTNTNKKWTLYRLLIEMEREHKAYTVNKTT